jgi:F420-dependent oxidoreductase-like protein
MRFAFKTAPQNTTWEDMLAVWKAGDEMDVFESGWTFDHFYPIFSDPTGPCLEGWVTLAALAQATRRLRMGVMVTGIHYRHPAVLANMAATLDIISGGRLEVGIGAGWNQEESGAYGIPLGTPRDRSDRFEEACQVLTCLFRDTTTDFEGRFYKLNVARCEPKPVQSPLPICIGGNGEKRTLRTAARYANHWNFVGGSPQDFAHKREALREHCAAIGRDPAEIVLSSHVPLGSDGDPGPGLEAANRLSEEGLDLAIFQLRPPHRPTVLEKLAEAIASSR